MVQLGLLDYAPIDEGEDARAALNNTVSLAKLADTLGFTRFWLAEHHNVPAFASSSPEMLMMHLADQTNHIRIGSGGVMLPHYSPFKVAENFRMLEAYHPNRIDLGIGNTIGTPIVNRALNARKTRKHSHIQGITDIAHYIGSKTDESHRFRDITANPEIPTIPEMWLLSASVRTAKLAAKLGTGYTYGLFPFARPNVVETGIKAITTYREEFRASRSQPKSKVSIAPFVVVAETNDLAEAYAGALDLWLLGKKNFSELQRFPSVETAANYVYTADDLAMIQRNRSRMVVGDVAMVTQKLKELIHVFGADEVLLIPLMPGIKARMQALELLSVMIGE